MRVERQKLFYNKTVLTVYKHELTYIYSVVMMWFCQHTEPKDRKNERT